jgi:hypothetical protein
VTDDADSTGRDLDGGWNQSGGRNRCGGRNRSGCDGHGDLSWVREYSVTNKKADVAKHLAEVFDHVGILSDEPPSHGRDAFRLVIQRYLLHSYWSLNIYQALTALYDSERRKQV